MWTDSGASLVTQRLRSKFRPRVPGLPLAAWQVLRSLVRLEPRLVRARVHLSARARQSGSLRQRRDCNLASRCQRLKMLIGLEDAHVFL